MTVAGFRTSLGGRGGYAQMERNESKRWVDSEGI